MEVFGVVAASVTLGAELLRLCRSFRKMAKGIRYARRDIAKLGDEMGIFASLYEDFLRVCVPNDKSKSRTTSPTRKLVSWTQDAIKDYKGLLDQVQALAGDSMDSVIGTVAAHVKWYLSKHYVKCLRASLSVARESMRGFSNVRIIEKLDEEIEMLRAAIARGERGIIEEPLGMTAEDRLEFLGQLRRNRREQRHEINVRLTEAREKLSEQQNKKSHGSDFVPETKKLLRFTRSVDRYVEEILPSRQSVQHLRSSDRVHPPTQQPRRADSAQQTSSTVTTSSVLRPSSPSSVTEELRPATPVEGHNDYLNYCSKCSGTCLRTEEHMSSISEAEPINTQSPGGFPALVLVEHSTHRPSRRRNKSTPASRSSSEEASSSTKFPNRAESVLNAVNPNRPTEVEEAVVKPSEQDYDLNEPAFPDDQWLNEDEDNSGYQSEVDEEIKDNAFSLFHPVAGVMGKFPPGWHKRHARSESPQDFWHRKL